MSETSFAGVQAIRDQHETLWREWQTWPASVRPTTGDFRADAVLLNPLLFHPADRVRIVGEGLQCFYDVPQSAVAIPRQGSTLKEKVRAVCEHRPVATGALFDERFAPAPVVGVMDMREMRADADFLITVVYDLRKLLEEGPWAPDALASAHHTRQ